METKPARIYKTHDPEYYNNYYREYYAVKINCPHCERPVSRAKLPRHMRMTKACLLLRAQAELKQLKGEPEQPEKVEVPEAPALDVKWMVCPKVAKKL